MALSDHLQQALQRRQTLIPGWREDGTESFRLFHGIAEGRPGLSVDAYGSLVLAQVSAASPLTSQESTVLTELLTPLAGTVIVALRQGPKLQLLSESSPDAWSSTYWCRELGLDFAINLSKAHRDPQLFLDFRAAKRTLITALRGARTAPSVLNLFAYTCSVSCHAAAAGAKEVWSVDFSAGNLRWGEKNFRRNRLLGEVRFLEEDCIGTLWALSGRRAGRRGLKVALPPRQFDVVVADPPVLAKGKFAAVDLVRDPETIFGPAWEVVAPGGMLIAANNSAKVSRLEFEERLRKLLDKRGGDCREMQWVTPDDDFPSFDGEYPLKVAICHRSLG